MGKYAFLSTNGSGPRFYLDLIAGNDQDPVASLSSPSQVNWIAYDGGSRGGIQLLIFATAVPDPLYLYVYAALGWVRAGASIVQALPVSLVSAGGSLVFWQAMVAGAPVEASYDIASDFAGLVFQAGTAGATLAPTLVTPSLATARSSGSAAGYDFSGADLTGSDLSGIDCTEADFSGCILARVDFRGATLTRANFTGCDLRNAIWGTNLQACGANFTSCIGRGTSFPSDSSDPNGQATFAGATFTASDFSASNFAGANLDGAFLYGATFSGSNLGGANLSSVNGGLSGGRLGVDLSWSYMADANLQEAHLEGANLSHAQVYFLSGGKLDSAVLVDTNFVHADLTGMSFNETTIMGANFTGAALINCAFTTVAFAPSAQSLPVCMSGAHLEGATFTSATTLTSVQLDGAYIADANGVPLFATPMESAYATALNAGQVPAAFPSLFAGFGCNLSASAVVSPAAANRWTLVQPPAMTAVGVEITRYLVVVVGATLTVYASGLSLVEVGADQMAFALCLTVMPTTLDVSNLDPTTHCPNGATVATNQASGLTWEEMLMSPRQPVASTAT
jgi:uncharacterized protein YjbI with pentapeptide repeats